MSHSEGDKSVGQNISDTVGGSSKPGEKGYVEQAQDALASAGTTVQNTANGMLSFFLTFCELLLMITSDLYNKAAEASKPADK